MMPVGTAQAQEKVLSGENGDNDIVPFSVNSCIADRIIDITDQLREAKNEGASETELNQLADLLLHDKNIKFDSGDINLKSSGDITDRLNPKTQALYDKHRAKALLCIANGVFATRYAERYYERVSLHNGNGDAFRHVLWNFGMVIDVGYDFAKKWSDAHEYGTPNNPALEKQMNLYNNGVGLRLGNLHPNTILHSSFIKKSMSRVDNGFGRVIVNGNLTWSDSSGKK